MIKKLLIKNFQTHAHRKIELSPTITTIVGKSDVGKSAIYRAIRWVATGLPKGNDFIRWGEKSASVGLEVDKHKIIRKKGSSNLYKLDGKEFKALRTDVPEEIKGILNLDAINFQSQHDSPFWFSETAGEISRQLNAIVSLSLIDTSIKNAISKARQNKIVIDHLETQIDGAKKDVVRMGAVLDLQKLLKEVEKAVTKEESLSIERDQLQTLFEQGMQKRKVCKSLQSVVGYLDQNSSAWKKVQTLRTKVGSLKELVTSSEKHVETLRIPIPSTHDLNPLFENIEDLEKKVIELHMLIGTSEIRKEKYDTAMNELSVLETQLVDEFKGRCPLCGNPV